MMNITVLGTGIMGGGIAKVLAAQEFNVTAWNRTISHAAHLKKDSVHIEPDIRKAVSQADIIAIVVFDADSVMNVLEQASASAPSDAIWVQMSTIGKQGARKVDEYAKNHGLNVIETMMMGSKDQANSSQLVLMGGGSQTLFDRANPFTKAVSKKLVFCGPHLGDGTAVKLACNLWLGSITVAASQSLKVLEQQHVDPRLFLNVIDGGTTDSPYAHLKGAKILAHDYSAQFEVSALEKDLGLMKDVMQDIGFRNDLLTTVLGLYTESDKNGHTHDDVSAVATTFD
ncbi:MAG: NAD(P)-dependent oxidoreductase [Bifidobacterium aquikefiri]|nr:NAD(P)-dependent oxidoreductase [Bifidobacterium aquikefiri]